LATDGTPHNLKACGETPHEAAICSVVNQKSLVIDFLAVSFLAACFFVTFFLLAITTTTRPLGKFHK